MKLTTTTHKDGAIEVKVTLEVAGTNYSETVSISEWSKLIANPEAVEEK